MKPVRFDVEAENELSTAYAWYEAQAKGLGDALISVVDKQLTRIQRAPQSLALAPEVASNFGVRRALCHQFPFSVIFVELVTEIRVLAIAHQSRRPGYWRRRIRKQAAH